MRTPIMIEEVWKDVPDYPGLQASSLGNIRTIDRTMPYKNEFTRGRKGVLLKPISSGPYLCVTYKGRSTRIHRLIAKTFLPLDEGRSHVNHKNGNKLDNRAVNLEWCTPLENLRHAWENGLIKGQNHAGENNTRSRLTTEDILTIRTLRGTRPVVEIAKDYGVTKYHIYGIFNNHCWKHV